MGSTANRFDEVAELVCAKDIAKPILLTLDGNLPVMDADVEISYASDEKGLGDRAWGPGNSWRMSRPPRLTAGWTTTPRRTAPRSST
jgi:hypothetical protein